MLKGIEFARRRDWPLLATCGGFQYALIEFARNVVGIADADTAENNSGSKNIVIYPVACAVPNRKKDAPKLSGAVPEIRLRPGSYLQSFYGKDKDTTKEEFFCNFEVNPEYEWCAMEAGFPIVARGAGGEIRAIESPTHRFFLATLFQPQLSSRIPWYSPLFRPPPTGAARSSTTACSSSPHPLHRRQSGFAKDTASSRAIIESKNPGFSP